MNLRLKKTSRTYDLEDRLIEFAVTVIRLTEKMPRSFIGSHLAGQLGRSAISPALLYGEAQSAESRNDFIHKMKISLKELRESNCSLKIAVKLGWLKTNDAATVLAECNELVAIFVKSITTATKNKIIK